MNLLLLHPDELGPAAAPAMAAGGLPARAPGGSPAAAPGGSPARAGPGASPVGAGPARVVLSGRRARHVCRVLRSRPGDTLRVGVIRGPRGTARVVRVARADGAGGLPDVGGAGEPNEPDEVELLVALDQPAPPRPDVDLVLALPRPKAVGRALQTAAALGVGRIDIVNAWRVDKSYFAAARLAPDALRAEVAAGCEQGATTWLPDVAVHRLLMPFLRGDLPARMRARAGQPAARDAGAIGIIAHPRADARLEDAVTPGEAARVIAAIGPEGGWIDRELDSFARLGFTPVRLGDRVLRVDTAIAATLAQLALLRRLPPAR